MVATSRTTDPATLLARAGHDGAAGLRAHSERRAASVARFGDFSPSWRFSVRFGDKKIGFGDWRFCWRFEKKIGDFLAIRQKFGGSFKFSCYVSSKWREVPNYTNNLATHAQVAWSWPNTGNSARGLDAGWHNPLNLSVETVWG